MHMGHCLWGVTGGEYSAGLIDSPFGIKRTDAAAFILGGVATTLQGATLHSPCPLPTRLHGSAQHRRCGSSQRALWPALCTVCWARLGGLLSAKPLCIRCAGKRLPRRPQRQEADAASARRFDGTVAERRRTARGSEYVRIVFGARLAGGEPAGSVIDADFLFLAGATRPDKQHCISTLPDGRGPPPCDLVGVGGMLKRALCRAGGCACRAQLSKRLGRLQACGVLMMDRLKRGAGFAAVPVAMVAKHQLTPAND